MKNYLKSLQEPIRKAHFFVVGVTLAGLNLGLLAAFLILFVFFGEVQYLVLEEMSYPYLTAIVSAVFVVISVKLWIDYGVLLRERFRDLGKGEKLKKVLIVDLIGILPLLALVLLKNAVDGLKYLANPSSVTSGNVANSLILLVALIIQIVLVEVVALRGGSKDVREGDGESEK
ncbi:hypothetical protein HQ544_02400 [Candidatus Falkowbacteria bacterium]|nr:hypothetical protein [Candidatus Falkowbacteria bacterium]